MAFGPGKPHFGLSGFAQAILWGAALILPGVSGNCTAQKLASADSAVSCRAFVQGFYDWYVPIASQEGGVNPSDIALQRRAGSFSTELATALKKDSEAQRHSHEIVGLDWDPFLASQDPSPRFVVDSVKPTVNHCTAVVYGIDHGSRREKVMPELAFTNGRWVFVNFHYEDRDLGKYDLLETLRELAKNRQR